MIVRGTLGVGGQWVFSPLYEWRSGFPWSAVDEFQDFVGPRNRTGRLPTVSIARLHARPTVALPEVPLHGRHQDLQRVRHRQRARRAEQHHRARLRAVLQPDSAVDRIRVRHDPAVIGPQCSSGVHAARGTIVNCDVLNGTTSTHHARPLSSGDARASDDHGEPRDALCGVGAMAAYCLCG